MKKPLRFRTKKKRVSFLRLRFFWYAIGALFLLTSLFYIIVFSSFLKIEKIEIQGVREIALEHILSASKDYLWQTFLGIPQNSILLFDIKGLKEELTFTFPAISSVTLKRSLPQTLIVKIQEREQIGTWCPFEKIDEEVVCFAIDEKGIPFKNVEKESEYILFSSKGEVRLGKELLDPLLLLTLLDFKEESEKIGESFLFSIIAFTIGERGEIQGVTKEGWKILLDIKEDMGWQQTKLQIVLEQKIPLEKRGELEYIDLRFGDQAYIKYFD